MAAAAAALAHAANRASMAAFAAAACDLTKLKNKALKNSYCQAKRCKATVNNPEDRRGAAAGCGTGQPPACGAPVRLAEVAATPPAGLRRAGPPPIRL